ncbi:DEAD/DEAH box helicase [Canibacter oris]|uniref:Superfamily II DNA/RNA helicase n=1 Tax=Canibacter oris TaxID=1365628 RepID=A0A840DKL3_9MICO|nr:DEAD/DEAH box helicase [Canibacter oris]MBB4072253.1 superfamily II DNA/RNA helicase [Canibacter oris]
MARKQKRGFKAPKNYDPNRGKKRQGRSAHQHQGRDEFSGGSSRRTQAARFDRSERSHAEHFRGERANRGGGVRSERSGRRGGGDYDRGGNWRGDFEHRGNRGGDYQHRSKHGGGYAAGRDGRRRGQRPEPQGRRQDYERDMWQRSNLRDGFEQSRRRQQPQSGRIDAVAYQRYERENGSRVHFFGNRDDAQLQRQRESSRSRDERSGRGVQAGREDRFVHSAKQDRKRGAKHGAKQGFGKGGFMPTPDVVLERLEATQTSAADVAHLSFSDLGLGDRLCDTLAEMGATSPFAIQAATIPDVLQGRDVLGRGRTGSGKTIAFGAALVERLLQLKAEGLFDGDPQPPKRERGKRREFVRGRAPKALIMAPTRELALQIDKTVQPLARAVGLFTTQVVGGASLARQQHALKLGVDIVIGTPGRVEDLIERGDLNIGKVAIAVLDEADHMAELGFVEPVQRIWRGVAPGAQKLLFSATLDAQVTKLVTEFLVEPAVHEVAEQEQSTSEHHVLVVLREDKTQVLTEILAEAVGSVIVFTRTRAYAETLREMCEDADIKAVDLHGNLNQAKRERNLKRFADGKARVLVATDVAARGIHVDDVALVVQADPPDDYKTYLHRAGRTGRAGNTGTVVTVIPRNRQKRTRQLFENAQLAPAFFGDFGPGDVAPWQETAYDVDYAEDFTAGEAF